MKYVALIYADPDGWEAVPEDERQRISEKYMALAREPVSVGGEQLEDADTATTVRVRDGETLTTDGPFAAASTRRSSSRRAFRQRSAAPSR